MSTDFLSTTAMTAQPAASAVVRTTGPTKQPTPGATPIGAIAPVPP